ncbi:MAG: hypothetical protein Q9160_001043 [Pyrenula sp. 1 TL-2023]
MSKPRTPVYFLSTGGPNIMYNKTHPAYTQLISIGREITTQVRPRAVVVFSAHWQSPSPSSILVNTSESVPLIYDFYNFPAHYYEEKYPHRGSKEVAGRVMKLLGEAGIKSEGVERGLDHGIWSGFKVLFEPGSERELKDVPIVQVSMFGGEDVESHMRLGRAVEKLREEGVLVMVTGMTVHNLRAFRNNREFKGVYPFAESFDEALREAVEGGEPGEERNDRMVKLVERDDARQAHPTFDHLLPIHISVGAAGNDKGKRLWTLPEGSMAWGQFRFGEVTA